MTPIRHTCCGTPCAFEYRKDLPCWGDISCVDYTILEEGDEIRHAACAGHVEMWPSCDPTKYIPDPGANSPG